MTMNGNNLDDNIYMYIYMQLIICRRVNMREINSKKVIRVNLNDKVIQKPFL